mgnify:CR=1 FL=1
MGRYLLWRCRRILSRTSVIHNIHHNIDIAVDNFPSVLSKFSDDTKWGKTVENKQDQKDFQEGLNNLMECSKNW